jgi:hypothetical protein
LVLHFDEILLGVKELALFTFMVERLVRWHLLSRFYYVSV